MKTVIPVKATSSKSPAEKTFHRLKKEIEELQKERQELFVELDRCMLFYTKETQPLKQKIGQLLEEKVLFLYGAFTTCSKSQKAKKKAMLIASLDLIPTFVTPDRVSSQVHDIVKEIHGIDSRQMVNEGMEMFKAAMEEMFRKENLDIDMSAFQDIDNVDDMLAKCQELSAEAKANAREKEEAPPSEKKKESKKEQKKQAAKDLQEKEINVLYRQLAKAFHPDLEQDPKEKEAKEALMQKLTGAYQDNDLYTLLRLEMDWLGEKQGGVSQGRMKLYTAVLKDQVKALKQEIQSSLFCPQYAPLREYLSVAHFNGIGTMQEELFDLERMRNSLEFFMKNVHSGEKKSCVHDDKKNSPLR